MPNFAACLSRFVPGVHLLGFACMFCFASFLSSSRYFGSGNVQSIVPIILRNGNFQHWLKIASSGTNKHGYSSKKHFVYHSLSSPNI